MTPIIFISIVTWMTFVSFGGALAFKYFTETRDVLWLVAGFAAYAQSNVAFILIMDQSGIARAMVLASVAQIILTTAAGFYFGEKIGVYSLAAAVAACIAAALTLAAPQTPPSQPDTDTSTHMEDTYDV